VAKDSTRITDGELQRLVESWGSESQKNKLQQIQLSDMTGTFKRDRILR